MKVNRLTLNDIFDRTERLDAPIFQRPYVWDEDKNWEPLWESIKNICDKKLVNVISRPHFIGTIVLEQIHTTTGKLNIRQIIDGRQRLTTFQLALAAIRDLCVKQNEKRYAETFDKLTTNTVPLSESDEDSFKVWPTNIDRDIFKKVMSARTPIGVRRIEEENGESKIPSAYIYFLDKFDEWLGTAGTEEFQKRLQCLYFTFRDNLHLVVIDLEQDDDAQEIFETLNALGTPLLPADLVKNYLFHMADIQKTNVEELYKKYWLNFDLENNYWRKETRQGRFKRPRLDYFLGHFLTLMMVDEVPATQLFSTYRDYVQGCEDKSAEKQMEKFRLYAEIYKSFDEFHPESREGLFFERLDCMDTSTLHPVLLELLRIKNGNEQKNELLSIFVDFESFLIRRTICELTTKNYNKLFIGLLKELKEKEINQKNIRDYLLNQETDISRWPDDVELLKAWKNNAFYKKQKRGRGPMILKALEAELHTKKTERLKYDDDLTIEHLLPEKWEKHWPLKAEENMPEYKEQEEIRENHLHRVGNLTLLTKVLNPSISNGPWDKKLPEILKHSALNLNRLLPKKWDETAIDNK